MSSLAGHQAKALHGPWTRLQTKSDQKQPDTVYDQTLKGGHRITCPRFEQRCRRGRWQPPVRPRPPAMRSGDVQHAPERLTLAGAVGREPTPIEGEDAQDPEPLAKQDEGGIRNVHRSIRVL